MILATGSAPALPSLPGLDDSPITVLSADDVLHGRADGAGVAVLLDEDGHHKAASTAEYLAAGGTEVHLVTRADVVAWEITSVSRTPAIERLDALGVRRHPSHWFASVAGSTVHLGSGLEVPNVDVIVAVVPNRPRRALADELTASGESADVLIVGDCLAPRRGHRGRTGRPRRRPGRLMKIPPPTRRIRHPRRGLPFEDADHTRQRGRGVIDTDVVIVGYGTAGASAAIAAVGRGSTSRRAREDARRHSR